MSRPIKKYPTQPLGSVLKAIESGRSFQTLERAPTGDELGVLKVSAVSWTSFNPNEAKAVVGHTPSEHHRVRKGDILISRANTRDLVGAVVHVDKDYPNRLLSDKTLRLIVDEDRINPDFLLLALRASDARTHIESFATGTSDSMRNIGQSVIRSVPIPFMPIEEQRHIAKRVHAQLASAQTARFAAEAQINETEFLPRTILANAFGRGFRVAGSRTNDGIHTAMVRLGAIAEVQLGKMLSPKSKTGQAPFPYLRNQDVQWGRVNVKDLPTMDFSEQERTKFELCQGDLLVCEGGEPGRCAVWQGEFEPCYFQKALHRIRSRSGQIDMEFLMFWLRHQAWMGTFDHQNAKTTIAHLPRARLLNILVPAISIEEQHAIVDRIKHLLAAAETTRIASYAQLKEIQRLPERILATAFGDGERAA